MAARAVVLRVARHAHYSTIVLVEIGPLDRFTTLVAAEVLGVPLFVQRRYYLKIQERGLFI